MFLERTTLIVNIVQTSTISEKAGSSTTKVGVSPGRKIDMQGKVFQQLELIHNMFERGAVTTEQFELRKMSIMKQMEKLDD